MTLQTKMSKYLFWADSTIWDIVQNLTDEEYSRDLYENGGSIQRRYAHLAEAVWEWYHDSIGQEEMEEADFMNL
ncbi:MAG: DinB family protein, partial [Candidatus Thorarchaeota archaeon]